MLPVSTGVRKVYYYVFSSSISASCASITDWTHIIKPCGFLPFSAERYDPLTSTWTSVAAMSTRRRYVRVATLGGNQLKICFS